MFHVTMLLLGIFACGERHAHPHTHAQVCMLEFQNRLTLEHVFSILSYVYCTILKVIQEINMFLSKLARINAARAS